MKKKEEDIQCTGAYSELATVLGLHFTKGRFFTQDEVKRNQLVVVIDQATVKTIFGSPDQDVLGEHLYISGKEYTIVGIIENPATAGANNMLTAYVPYTTCLQNLDTWSSVDQAYGLAYEGLDMQQVANQTKSWLAAHFKVPEEDQEYSVFVLTMDSVIRELDAMVVTFRMLILAVASISLLVGGIGIMNMMLTNVTERIREIGLRKALGARRIDVTSQFLLEAVCLTLLGGIIGIAVGIGISYPLAEVAGNAISVVLSGQEFSRITPVIDFGTILVATGISVAIGVIFGYYPARRAAKLDPVESLRYQ